MPKVRSLLVVTGARSEYGYLKPVLRQLRKSKKIHARVIVTGMHTQERYGYTLDEVKKDAILPIAAVVPVAEDDTMLEALAKEISGIEAECLAHRPDMMLVIADRDEGFAGAIVAGHLGIPLAHMSGGDTSGYGVDEPIRHSISKFAHIHFTWTPQTGKRLRAMGEEAWRIHVTGSTAFDALRETKVTSREKVAAALGLRAEKPWIILVQHPTPLDTIPVSMQLGPTLEALKSFDADLVILYPNSDTGSERFVVQIERLREKENVHIEVSLPHEQYMSLLSHAAVLVGNSSSGILESGYFHVPTVDIGGRQKGRECGKNVIHVPYEQEAITRAVRRALSPAFACIARASKHPYDRGDASGKIVRTLEQLPLDERLAYKKIPL